jgi:hypothetical protein
MPPSYATFCTSAMPDQSFLRRAAILACTAALALAPASAGAQIKAQLPKGAMTPAWDKGIQPISRESYWNAVECGKQGGQRPLCVFYDADLCKNDDFTLALFTPYKQVSYEVWQAVTQKQDPPTPSYGDAQRTRITLGVTPVAGSKNPIASVAIKRGARVVKPATQSLDGGTGRFIFDFPAFAPTEDITIELTGRARTQTCLVEKSILSKFR